MKKLLIVISLLISIFSCIKKDDNVIQSAYMFPNPFTAYGSSLATFRTGFKQAVIGETISVTVYDLNYQTVWAFTSTITANPHDISWGGENQNGITVAPGIYLVKINVNGSLSGEEWFRIIIN